jgi:hypothetical protein
LILYFSSSHVPARAVKPSRSDGEWISSLGWWQSEGGGDDDEVIVEVAYATVRDYGAILGTGAPPSSVE